MAEFEKYLNEETEIGSIGQHLGLIPANFDKEACNALIKKGTKQTRLTKKEIDEVLARMTTKEAKRYFIHILRYNLESDIGKLSELPEE